MKKFKNFSSGLISFMIVYFIFCTMNELVAQLIFFFGLSIIGVYIFRLSCFIIYKLKNIKFCDCGFWDRDGIYNWDIKLVDFDKEPYTRNEIEGKQQMNKEEICPYIDNSLEEDGQYYYFCKLNEPLRCNEIQDIINKTKK